MPFLRRTPSCRRGSLPGVLATVVLLALAAAAPDARAHDPGLSTADGRFRDGDLDLTIGLAPTDAAALLPRRAPGTREDWAPLARRWCEVTVDGRSVPPTHVKVDQPSTDSLRFTLTFPGVAGRDFELRLPRLAELPPGHREFVVLVGGDERPLFKQIVAGDRPMVRVGAALTAGTARAIATPARAIATPAWAFVRLGVEHIWTGYDHLLFLFGLLVVCRSFRSVAAIISCFTLAHSLTLAVATLGWVVLPSRVVEPAIAASIVFVGVENLARRGAEPRGRWALTFAFGLVHGFGFATALRELGVGGDFGGAVIPLFAFNFGVELGQMAIAAVALPLVWRLRRREAFVQWGVPALSVVVAVAGGYWLVQRTLAA